MFEGETMQRTHYAMLTALALVAIGSWWGLIASQRLVDGDAMSMTMGMNLSLFLLFWTVMMSAMMLPSASPMILTFARVQGRRRTRDNAWVPTWVFALSYLVVWSAFGALAYGGALSADAVGGSWHAVSANAGHVGGALLILAGAYQLSPLKEACLSRCRTPMRFIMESWREGTRGALVMGAQHGLYCIGCCWLLFAILFPIGIMNLAAMASVALLVAAEKTLPVRAPVAVGSAVALMAFGLFAVIDPAALPVL